MWAAPMQPWVVLSSRYVAGVAIGVVVRQGVECTYHFDRVERNRYIRGKKWALGHGKSKYTLNIHEIYIKYTVIPVLNCFELWGPEVAFLNCVKILKVTSELNMVLLKFSLYF